MLKRDDAIELEGLRSDDLRLSYLRDDGKIVFRTFYTNKYQAVAGCRRVHAVKSPSLFGEFIAETYCGVERRSKTELVKTDTGISCLLCIRAIEVREFEVFEAVVKDLLRLSDKSTERGRLLHIIKPKIPLLRLIASRIEDKGCVEIAKRYRAIADEAEGPAK